MSENPRPVRLSDPVSYDDRWITFAATDRVGPLLIRVGRIMWEQFQADAPYTFNADYRRDYALGMIEAQAAALTAVTTRDGRVLTLRPHDA